MFFIVSLTWKKQQYQHFKTNLTRFYLVFDQFDQILPTPYNWLLVFGPESWAWKVAPGEFCSPKSTILTPICTMTNEWRMGHEWVTNGWQIQSNFTSIIYVHLNSLLKTSFLAQNKQISQSFEREKILQFLFQIFTKYLS